MCGAEPSDCAGAAPCACALMPTLALVQHRPSCPYNPHPFCHGLHTLGPPHPFFHLLYQRNRVQSDTRYGFRNLPVLSCPSRIAIIMQNIHRAADGDQFFQNSAAKHSYPGHKIPLAKTVLRNEVGEVPARSLLAPLASKTWAKRGEPQEVHRSTF